MPSTIAAGTTAGTAIAITGDTTGNLAFQTNGTTTAMTIDTSQNVGIGTSSPSARLDVAGLIRLSTNSADPTDASASVYNAAFIGPTISGLNVAFRTGGTPAERMRIDSDGRVTTPFQPAFSALRTTGNNFGGSYTNLGNFNTTYVNIGSNFNATTGVFTAPVTGNYLFMFSFRGNDGSANSNGVTARINKNGSPFLLDVWGAPGQTYDSGFRNFVVGSTVMNMVGGDSAAVQVLGNFLQGGFSGCLLG